MTILEITIFSNGENLVTESYYPASFGLDKNFRNRIVQAIHQMGNDTFKESVKSLSFGKYTIILRAQEVETFGAKPKHNFDNSQFVICYCVVDEQSDEKEIVGVINEVLFHFLNRYSWDDIKNNRIRKFKEFIPRFKKILGDLVYHPTDRFDMLF